MMRPHFWQSVGSSALLRARTSFALSSRQSSRSFRMGCSERLSHSGMYGVSQSRNGPRDLLCFSATPQKGSTELRYAAVRSSSCDTQCVRSVYSASTTFLFESLLSFSTSGNSVAL